MCIANETKVQVQIPVTIASEQLLVATISSRNSRPTSVSCTLPLVASEPMTVEVELGSVQIINQNETNGTLIDSEDIFGEGALIGTNSMTGIVLYGAENAGSVEFDFSTVSLGQKLEPTATPQPVITATEEPTVQTTATPPESIAEKNRESGGDKVLQWITFFCLVLLVIAIIGVIKTKRQDRDN